MIEINRKLYMKSERNLAVKNNDFHSIKKLVKCLITNLISMY